MAQAILDLIPNYIQILVDDTAGTTTIQWWNGSVWVNLQQTTNSTGAHTVDGTLTASGLVTASAGITGTGNTGTLTGGTGILATANTWTAEQTLSALLASTGAPYGAGVFPSILGATTAQKIQSGTGSTAVATAGTAVTTAVTFATAFVAAPLVVLGQLSASGGTAGYIVTLAASPTTTGFTATVNSYLAQTIGWSWVAIGN